MSNLSPPYFKNCVNLCHPIVIKTPNSCINLPNSKCNSIWGEASFHVSGNKALQGIAKNLSNINRFANFKQLTYN